MLKPIISLFSSVGGGPLERLHDALKKDGCNAQMCTAFSPESWRRLFSKGASARLAARALSFGLYPLGALAKALKSSACTFTGPARRKSVLIVSTNPFFLPHFLLLTRALHRSSVIALMYDMYPDALEVAGKSHPLFTKLWTKTNKALLKRADAVVYLGDEMRKAAESRYAVNPLTAIIPTGAKIDEFRATRSVLDKELISFFGDKCVFSYVGNFGLMHDSSTLLEAIPAFLENHREDAVFVFASTGPETEKLKIALQNDESIRFLGPLEDDAWVELIQRSHVSLVSLKIAARHTSVPSKVYSALAGGNVILSISPKDSDLAQLIETEDCGIRVEPGDVAACVEAMKRLSKASQRSAFATNVARAAKKNDISMLSEHWQEIIESIEQNSVRTWSQLRYDTIKRSVDILASSVALVALCPILLATAGAVAMTMGRPILFSQERPGLDGRPFKLRKFRSMALAKEGEGAETDGVRLTKLGKFLRATSIDELPTLWNVLIGDMSLVGPRPLLTQYLQRYTTEQARRHEVKPGITGWAQINGRNAISWEKKFEHDVWYVDNASLWLDLRILWMTFGKVFSRKDIAHQGSATMPEFMGSE
ncbi:MAG: sugar transferase [Bradymonadia bacterium]|jgi:sugar transferase EpsL